MWKVLTYSEDVFVKHTQMMDGSRSASVSGLLKVALRASVVWLERLASELAPPQTRAHPSTACATTDPAAARSPQSRILTATVFQDHQCRTGRLVRTQPAKEQDDHDG
jgi:hypothetical protein